MQKFLFHLRVVEMPSGEKLLMKACSGHLGQVFSGDAFVRCSPVKPGAPLTRRLSLVSSSGTTVLSERTEAYTAKGYSRSRVVGPLDQFFLCGVCRQVAAQPKECKDCQKLVCFDCELEAKVCPFGCGEKDFGKLSNFVDKHYGRIKLHCSFRANGCKEQIGLKDIEAHEVQCIHRVKNCSNPCCQKRLTAEFCSAECALVVQFQTDRELLDREKQLSLLAELMKKARKALYEEVRYELKTEYQELREYSNRARREPQGIRESLEAKRSTYHSGKYLSVSGNWSCCRETLKTSIGCKIFNKCPCPVLSKENS